MKFHQFFFIFYYLFLTKSFIMRDTVLIILMKGRYFNYGISQRSTYSAQ